MSKSGNAIQPSRSNIQTDVTPKNSINRKVEGSLGWHGRDKVDPKAPYGFTLARLPTSNYYSDTGIWSELPRREQLWQQYTVQFYENIDNDVLPLTPGGNYNRQAWVVGIAANPWRAARGSGSYIKKSFAHWGVYILPQSVENQESSYRIFGMNFRQEYKGELILEDVWGTPGEERKGMWKKSVSREEFQKVDKPGLQEAVMYFSLEEFVLTLQWILRSFVDRRISDSTRDVLGEISPHPGKVYSLFNAHCQHFAAEVIRVLKAQNWTDPSRLQESFSLAKLEMAIRLKLIAQSKKADEKDSLAQMEWQERRNLELPEMSAFLRS